MIKKVTINNDAEKNAWDVIDETLGDNARYAISYLAIEDRKKLQVSLSLPESN